jgi:hypothetical protein
MIADSLEETKTRAMNEPLDSIRNDEQRKSRLILEARLLRDRKEHSAAADKFAEAAEMEEQISRSCESVQESQVHQFSAASLWAQAGNFYQSLAICEQLLTRADLPDRLRERVQSYSQALRSRRDRWYEELVVQSASGEN